MNERRSVNVSVFVLRYTGSGGDQHAYIARALSHNHRLLLGQIEDRRKLEQAVSPVQDQVDDRFILAPDNLGVIDNFPSFIRNAGAQERVAERSDKPDGYFVFWHANADGFSLRDQALRQLFQPAGGQDKSIRTRYQLLHQSKGRV